MNPSEENFLNNLLSAFRRAALPAGTNSFRAEEGLSPIEP
jgi:hypothetical protein